MLVRPSSGCMLVRHSSGCMVVRHSSGCMLVRHSSSCMLVPSALQDGTCTLGAAVAIEEQRLPAQGGLQISRKQQQAGRGWCQQLLQCSPVRQESFWRGILGRLLGRRGALGAMQVARVWVLHRRTKINEPQVQAAVCLLHARRCVIAGLDQQVFRLHIPALQSWSQCEASQYI